MMKRILSSRGLLLAALLGLASAFGWGAISRADADHAASAGAPETPRASLALGYHGDEPQIRAAQDAVHRQPESAVAYARLALSMLQRKRETADPAYLHYAIDALDAARELDPEASEVLLARILVSHEEHRFSEARTLARRLIARTPGEPTGHLLLGDAHLELGDYKDALAAYQKALDLRPDLRSYNRAAHLRWLHGDVEGAIDLLELAIEAGSPRDPEAMAWCYVDLGEIYRKLGDGKRALRAAQRARTLISDYRPALVLEARARLLLGDADKAVKLLERAVAHHPRVGDLLLLSQLGQRGRLAEAEALADEDPRPLAFYYARLALHPERALALA
ncbi:MAG TPA: tetratricopeptide repeat protein, partial [Polyangiaceae bacterium]|nr:tetratricopeptide repeat protein [Polyangiaceae bacterium]